MNADRNLLFGILALQNDFVSSDELVAAMNDWIQEKSTPLGDILKRRDALSSDVFGLLDALVEKQIAKHHGDVRASIAALSSVANARSALASIDDEQVQATMQTFRLSSNGSPAAEPYFDALDEANGRFTVLRPHAAGGLGEVFVAKDNELGREVALKQIKGQYSKDGQLQARFKLEAEVTGGLEHPGIVPVYSLGAYADGRPFYAMRFIRGDSLKEAIEQFHRRDGGGPDYASLPFRGLLRRFIDVCNAIAYAHSRGILHRDLKPGNIMLGKYGETLVVDWGLAKATGAASSEDELDPTPLMPPSASGSGYDATEQGLAIGTPAYMSPEQAEGKVDQLGPATDVYSLGATLFSVLTGQAPFKGKAIVEILEGVRRGGFPKPRSLQPALPQALEAICVKAMSLQPIDRYPSALELANDVERWLGDEPVTAFKEPLSVRTKRWIRKHPGPAAALTAAVLVGFIGVGIGISIVNAKNRALDNALANETTEREKAVANEKKAEAEFRRAKKAIDEYFTDVSESRELKQKFQGMHAFRLKLLEKAQRYYEAFLRERGGDPALQADAAQALMNCAYVAVDIGKKPQAHAAFESALKIYEELARSNPDIKQYQLGIAKSHNGVGLLNGELGKPKEALTNFHAAQTILERLWRENPRENDYAAHLSLSLNNLGVEKLALGKREEALTNFQSALKLRESLARANPTDSQYAVELASSHMNLGFLQSTAGKFPDALANYQAGLKALQRIGRDDLYASESAAYTARLHFNIAIVQTAMNKPAEAMVHCREALKIQEKLARDNPSVTEYAVDLAKTHNSLAIRQYGAGQATEAMASFQAAIKILEKLARDNPQVTSFALELAGAHSNLAGLFQEALDRKADALSNYQAAVKIFERLVHDDPAAIRQAIYLGGTYSNMAVLVRDAEGPSQSLPLFAKALAALKGRSERDATGRQYLRSCYCERALALARLDRTEEALADYASALQWADGPDAAAIRKDRDALRTRKASKPKDNAPGGKAGGDSKSRASKVAKDNAAKKS